MHSMNLRAAVGAAAVLALLGAALAACGQDGGADGPTLRVYAAASLATPFEQIAEEFEREHQGVRVELAVGGSADLVAQLREGAPGDVFASADLPTMDRLTAEDLQAGEPGVFATNTLEIAVPPDNPAGVGSFADLAEEGVDVVVCAPEVPCGAAAVEAQEAAGVELSPVSEEQSVTDVLGKVTSGEADAGLVYVTDLIAAGDAATGIALPEAAEVVNSYPIVALAGSGHDDLAREFVELVLDDTGQALLREAGFAQP